MASTEPPGGGGGVWRRMERGVGLASTEAREIRHKFPCHLRCMRAAGESCRARCTTILPLYRNLNVTPHNYYDRENVSKAFKGERGLASFSAVGRAHSLAISRRGFFFVSETIPEADRPVNTNAVHRHGFDIFINDKPRARRKARQRSRGAVFAEKRSSTHRPCALHLI